MKLPPELKKKVLDELEFIIKKMKEEGDLSRKVYFYSAVRGTLERTTRHYFDRELLVAHIIADASYQIINDRINRIKSGDINVPITVSLLNELTEGVSKLRQAVEKDEVVYPAIEKIIEVTYMATGPGFYTRSFLDYVDSKQHSQEGPQ